MPPRCVSRMKRSTRTGRCAPRYAQTGTASGASALGTFVERTTRPTLLVPLRAKEATSVRQAFARERRPLPQQMTRPLTDDQGQEMAEHEWFPHETRIHVYFAPPPHSPWERGTNENTNGLIRQCFPKGTDFSRVSRRQITHGHTLLNARPRKGRTWRTPSKTVHNVPVALGT